MRGWIDACTQTTISGWTTGPWVEIYVNGESICKVQSGCPRADLIAAGIQSGQTFNYVFPKPLWLDDRVIIRLPDDSQLVPSEKASHTLRLKQLLLGIDLSKPGLEFGPLNRPIVPRGRAEVYYVDHDDREGLKRKYAAGIGDEINKIPQIDYVWRDGDSLRDVVADQRFDWVIASHVGEHIADFMGWIGQLSEVLENKGRASLALPHRDRTFDARRQLSTFEDLLAAHIMKLTRPSAHQILGHMFGVSDFWNIGLKKPENLAELHNAINVARSAESGAYVDIHCSVFTPDSFQECYTLMEACGLAKLRLSSVTSTESDEFFVSLVKY
jgi:SAM-dependent methyltransferase